MSTHVSPHQQLHRESTNGHSTDTKRFSYPPATAKYEDIVQKADLFWEKLKASHESTGNKFKVPTVGGKALDLHQLFVEVTSRGGIEKVVKDRRWKEVIGAFRFPATITSASFILRKYYLSLLYQFELVYFHRQVPSISATEKTAQSLFNESTTTEEGASMNHSAGTPELHLGCSVIGAIDGKFDNGYLVTVKLGSEELKGVLYHIPNMSHVSPGSSSGRPWKRSRLALRDPSRPKSNRSGYNFFFAEHYAQLKPHYHGQERVISKKIGHLWNNLTEAEKQVYQEKGLKDKERYRTEMLEYKSSYDSSAQ